MADLAEVDTQFIAAGKNGVTLNAPKGMAIIGSCASSTASNAADEATSAALRAGGFQGLRLGPRILRTETAGLAAVAALQARFGDLG